jgi:hypothetical protein
MAKARERHRWSLAQQWVAILAVVMLGLAVANWIRLAGALYYRAVPELPLMPYRAALGGFWGSVFVACTVGLLGLWPWGRWATLIAVTVYQVHVWVNHFVFDASDYALQRRPRDAVLTLTLLAFVWLTLSWPSVRREFQRRSEERLSDK